MKHVKMKSYLIVVRLSDSKANKDLRKSVLQIAAMKPGFPGAATLARLGTLPLEKPDETGAQYFAQPGFRAALLRLPGTRTRVLMALGSATQANFGDDDNAFVQLLTDTLAEEPVDELWVADFARLLRSIDYLSQTWKAVRTSCRYVHHAGSVIDVRSPTAEIQFLFEALSAAADARAVVKRTAIGKMRAYHAGKFPFGPKTVPLGYQRNGNGQLRVADDPPRKVVRTIVQVLGDETLTNQERVSRVAKVGGTSILRSGQARRQVRVDQLSNAGDLVSRWYRLLELWQTGRWDMEYELPPLLHTTTFTVPVTIDDRPEGRVWRLSFKPGVPKGGWASEEAFRAAIARRDQRRDHQVPAGGTTAGRSRKPFCGLPPWQHQDTEYVLLSQYHSNYQLRARPTSEARVTIHTRDGERQVKRGWGRRPRLAGKPVGIIRADLLHTSVAEGIVDAAVKGLPLWDASQQLIESSDDLSGELVEALRQAERRAANAARNANEASTDVVRRSHLREQELAVADIDRLRQDLLRFAMPQHGKSLTIDADSIARVLASVATLQGPMPGHAADALRELIRDFRLIPIGAHTVQWEASLRIPFAGGKLTIGPASGTLELEREGDHHRARREASLAHQADRATQLFMADRLTLADVGETLGISTLDRVAQTIRDYLTTELNLRRAAAVNLVAYGTPSARASVWARLQGHHTPDGLDPDYVKHVADVYLTAPLRNDQSARRLRLDRIEATFQHLSQEGGWVADRNIPALLATANIGDRTLRAYLDGFARNGKHNPPILERHARGIGFRRCVRYGCRGRASIIALYPEVTAEVLCASCLRMPDLEHPGHHHPEDYR